MKDTKFHELKPLLPGDRVIRLRRRHQLRPLMLGWSEVFKVIRDLVLETPFIVMAPIVTVLLLIFSAGLYFAEVGAAGSNINSYGEAVWDGVVLMTTAGTMTEPVTGAGHVLGAIWTVLGCLLFYGTVIASVSAYFLLPLTSYFLLPHRSKEGQLIGTIQYNLGRLEQLSADDLEALKEETVSVIDTAIRQHESAK